jgi:uncharacterized membrane protein YbhN (UPF0104 family)
LGVDLPVEAFFLSLTASFANYLTITPSSLGILEGTVVFVSQFLSTLPEESLAVVLIIRFSILFSVLFFSLVFINHLKNFLKK